MLSCEVCCAHHSWYTAEILIAIIRLMNAFILYVYFFQKCIAWKLLLVSFGHPGVALCKWHYIKTQELTCWFISSSDGMSVQGFRLAESPAGRLVAAAGTGAEPAAAPCCTRVSASIWRRGLNMLSVLSVAHLKSIWVFVYCLWGVIDLRLFGRIFFSSRSCSFKILLGQLGEFHLSRT